MTGTEIALLWAVGVLAAVVLAVLAAAVLLVLWVPKITPRMATKLAQSFIASYWDGRNNALKERQQPTEFVSTRDMIDAEMKKSVVPEPEIKPLEDAEFDEQPVQAARF